MRRKYFFYILFLCIFVCHTDSKAQTKSPKYETRAVWLTTIGGLDWPHNYAGSTASVKQQKDELCHLLDLYKRAGINTVLLQTRIRGTVIYPSLYEPWDGCLSGVPGKSPGYDALAFAIEECHRRGMELHAWVVTIPIGKWNGRGCLLLRKKFPKLIVKIGDEGYMNPEDMQTGHYLSEICKEIASNYDIDGIHLDYIRYPETWPKQRSKHVTGDRKRQHITDIVSLISHRVKAIKPWVRMSCSPIGKRTDLSRFSSRGWNAYSTVAQDVEHWLKSGMMDMVFPMMYFRDEQFDPFAIDWKERSHGRIIAPGLGIYQLSPSERDWPLTVICRQMHLLRNTGMGHTYFRGRFLTDNVKGIYDFVAKDFDFQPALVEPMTWIKAERPEIPSKLHSEHLITDTHDHVTRLTWEQSNTQETIYYNVYSSRQWPVNTDDGNNLIASRLVRPMLTIKQWQPDRYYAVTSTNRYGIESRPLQQERPRLSNDKPYGSIPIADKRHELTDLHQMLDARYVVIETLQGNIVATIPYPTNGIINVADIPPGVYILRSLHHKGITHRLGFLKIKR